MKTIIETERLIIREIDYVDTDDMLAMHSDPEVHRYLGNNTITSKEKIEEAITSLKQQYADYGVGRWAMIEKTSNEFIGWTGLEFVTQKTNNHIHYYDLGYRLMKKYWGRGYATESALASVDYACNTLKIDVLNAIADCENAVSNHILQKVGLQCIETFSHDGVLHNWYELQATGFGKNI